MCIKESLVELQEAYDDGENATVVIAFHGPCMDGLVAGLVMQQAVLSIGQDLDLHYLEMQYTDESRKELADLVDKLDPSYVYIVDFSLPMAQLNDLANKGGKIFVLDHHKTAFESYFPDMDTLDSDSTAEYISEDIYILLDNGQSGAGLVLSEAEEFFTPSEGMRTLVSYVQDRDLWQHKLPNTKEVSAYLADLSASMQSAPIAIKLRRMKDVANFQFCDPESLAWVVREGAKCLAKRAELVAAYTRTHGCTFLQSALDKDHFVVWVPVMPADAALASDIGNALAKKNYAEAIGAVIIANPEGGYKVSLRSIGDVDVSAIAKFYGGGGHKNAAGFECLQWPCPAYSTPYIAPVKLITPDC